MLRDFFSQVMVAECDCQGVGDIGRIGRSRQSEFATDRQLHLRLGRSTVARQNPFDLRPEIYPTVCIGKIITHSKTEDGRYNLLLVGARRARIIREIMTDKAYRSAEVELVEDSVRSSEAQIAQLRKRLVKSFLKFAKEKQGLGQETIKNMLVDSMPISLLVDLISYAVGLKPEDQIKILETPEADLRCQYVLEMIEKMDAAPQPQADFNGPGFPPDFSTN